MILFDTETTGLLQPEGASLDQQPQIIEFAAIKLDPKTLKEKARLEFFVKPSQPISENITKITGITNEDLADAKPFGFHFKALADFFLGERHLVAHNITFDIGMLRNDLLRIGKLTCFPWPPEQICTIEASYSIEGHRLNLTKLHEKATGKPHKSAHRAMGDVEALVTCFKWLRKEGLV